MSKKNGFKALLLKIHSNKKLEIGIYAAIIVLAALLYFASQSSEKSKAKEENTGTGYAATDVASVERRLEETLSEIRGVGKVRVMITYDTSEELVPAMSTQRQSQESSSNNTDSRSSTESNQLATINSGNGQSPVVITEIQPKVRGVIVIAEGAADITVRMNLEYATATVLGIDSSAIEVFEMNSPEE